MATTVYIFSDFEPDAMGNGGQKRSAQLDRLVIECGHRVERITLNHQFRLSDKLRAVSTGIRFAVQHPRAVSQFRRKTLSALGYQINALNRRFQGEHDNTIAIWENTRCRNWCVPVTLKRLGFTVIAAPQNLESLVGGVQQQRWDRLSRELEILQHCDCVLTISREEYWLLRSVGLNTYFLPYTIARQTQLSMADVRARREDGSPTSEFLILGTVANPPTRAGLEALLRMVSKPRFAHHRFVVAGFRSEQMQSDVEGCSHIRFAGTVDAPELLALYTTATAAIIHQIPSSGALTRIPELLAADIPIVLNTISARTYANRPGIYEYETEDELVARLADVQESRAERVDNDSYHLHRFSQILGWLQSGRSER